MPNKEIVRVLRIIEYVGTRDFVEKTIANSIHGEKRIDEYNSIRASTIGEFPEILNKEATLTNERK